MTNYFKLLTAILFSLLFIVASTVSCGKKKVDTPPETYVCNHIDANNDGKCDNCNEQLENISENLTEIVPPSEYKAYTEGLEYSLTYDKASYAVTSIGTATDQDIIIPSVYNELPVTRISASAFYGLSKLTSITIPNSITTIESYAFEGCSGLTNITIPDSVKYIGWGAFKRCSSLESITIPFIGEKEDATSYYSHFGYIFGGDYETREYNLFESENYDKDYHYSFTEDNRISSGMKKYVRYYLFNIPKSLKNVTVTQESSISQQAFRNCSTLININFLSAITIIENSAFDKCSNLVNIALQDGATSIGDRAFNECINLTNINIPNSVTNIGSYAFYGCANLINITIPNNATKIGSYAFYGCENITSITIPGSISEIEASTFYGCKSLTDVTISNGVIKIGDNAFLGCYALSSFNIPDSIKEIGHGFLSGCDNIKYNEYDNAHYLGNQSNPYVFLSKAKDSSITTCIVHNDTTLIHSNAFKNCSLLKDITISESVISINDYAFYGCTNLTNLTIPETVTRIGAFAFYGCNNLTSIVLPSNVSEIESHTFYGCENLASITIPDNVTTIGSYAFYGCNNLTSIAIPNNVSEIESYTFHGCENLASITIPDKVSSIGTSAFEKCKSITEINFNSISMNDLSHNNYVFFGVGSNEENVKVTIGKNVTKIPAYLFEKVTYITIVAFEKDSVCKSIGDYAFNNCNEIISVTIGECVTEIGKYAFNSEKLVEVINRSQLDIRKGSDKYSAIAFYAKEVHNGESKIVDQCGHLFYTYNNTNYLVKYSGDKIDVVLPSSFDGKQYALNDFLFYDNTSIKSIVIPNQVIEICSYVFSGCTNLTEITLPESLYSIGKSAFQACKRLTSITIPSSVKYIGKAAFSVCDNLNSVYFEMSGGNWKVDGHLVVSVSDPRRNALYLKDTYTLSEWYKYS